MAETTIEALTRVAARLGRGARWRNPRARGVPSLFFLTDPERTPDPTKVMARLPRGTGVIYRPFGSPDAEAKGRALRRLARARRLVFLVGADAGLAHRLGADGVHLPERLMGLAPRLRGSHPLWLITAAAHTPPAIARAARLELHAALVSAVFVSASASAGSPMGAIRFAALAHAVRIPVIALGGINAKTARRLVASGAAGLAAIGSLTES